MCLYFVKYINISFVGNMQKLVSVYARVYYTGTFHLNNKCDVAVFIV